MGIHTVRRRWVVVGFFLLLTGFSVGPAALRADSSAVFSGQATVVRATLPLGTIVVSDTGPLPQTGGALEASLLDVSVPDLLTAEVAHASTVGQGDRSRSEASVAALTLTVGGNTIGADFLMARATAVCGPGGPSASGNSELARLVINGQEYVVTGAPNQTIGLPVGKVIINEQSSNGPGDITVNALHVSLPGLADVIIASAHADVTCPVPPPPPPCPGSDFVTGGGWIVVPSSGAKANFAVAGGIKNGANWGHLQYIDHGNGLRVKGTGVTKYTMTGPTSRHIEGTADIDGKPGTYAVDVADNGEPGRNDTFSLTLSTGYSAGALLDGGNIQLHSPCR